MWPLFCLDGFFVFIFSLVVLLNILVTYLLHLYFSPYSLLWVIPLNLMIGWCIPPLYYYLVGALTQRVRALVWVWQRAMRFVDEYGPGAPLAKRYGWFGTVGTVLGLFCGIALAGLLPPYTVIYLLYF